MSKRLPRPAHPSRQRCEVDQTELAAIEDMAHLCRLSLSAFIRVALIETSSHPERVDSWNKIASRIQAEAADEPTKKPGRPKKPKKKTD